MVFLQLLRNVFFFSKTFRNAIHIAGIHLPGEVRNQILKEYNKETKNRRKERTVSPGHWFMMRLAENTLSLFNAAKKAGLTIEEAYQLTENIVWQIAEPAAIAMNRLTFFIGGPEKRIASINNILWRTLWTVPFKRENVKGNSESYSFDVVQCPVSDYYKKQGVIQLCAEAFCSADYRFAQKWGTSFERKNTIAKGCDKCDFKFIINTKNQ
jgi:hypothetical protein